MASSYVFSVALERSDESAHNIGAFNSIHSDDRSPLPALHFVEIFFGHNITVLSVVDTIVFELEAPVVEIGAR